MTAAPGRGCPPGDVATLVDLLRWRAAEHPDRRALVFLDDGDAIGDVYTYEELDRRARLVAGALQADGEPGERVLLLYPPGLDFVAAFFGCLYAGQVAVPLYPPHAARLERSLPRLRAVARDTRARRVLTTVGLQPLVERTMALAPELATAHLLATDTQAVHGAADGWRVVMPESLAFLQYTSGSTAMAKGVMVSHHNLVHNSRMIQQAFRHDESCTYVSWLPLHHDMGLIGCVLQALWIGAEAILMPPAAFLQRPARWLQAISRHGGRTSGAPNFAYDLCTRRVSAEERASLDLSGWQLAFNGSEPVRKSTLDAFAATFAECGFRRESLYPCYGLAEVTLFASGGVQGHGYRTLALDEAALAANLAVEARPEPAARREIVSCGRPWLDRQVVIVDPATGQPCLPGQVGEIWLAGEDVARGYWDQPDASAETFRARLADGRGPYLRTGDLGFLEDAEVFVTGRLKDLVIVAGRNLYPQDLELTAEQAHPAVRPDSSAAFAVDLDDEERLVIVAEVAREFSGRTPPIGGPARAGVGPAPTLQDVARAIRQAAAREHDVQVYDVVLLRPASIPKTSSGKIQRRACRAELLAGTLPGVLHAGRRWSAPPPPDARDR